MKRHLVIILMCGLLFLGQIKGLEGKEPVKKTNTMKTIELMKKRILLDSSKVLFDKPLIQEEFAQEWIIHHSKWIVKDGWLEGENPGNWAWNGHTQTGFPRKYTDRV